MSDFTQEFGFLPPELVFKTHEFVRAYHDSFGSGWRFVRKSHIRAVRSGYLNDLERQIVRQGKVFQIALAVALVSVVSAILISVWSLIPVALAAVIATRMYRNLKFNLVQERGLILAMEILATDFACWGTLFPLSKRMATDWLETVAFGMEGHLLDTYMPLALRAKLLDDFKPSEGGETGIALNAVRN
jgi:hypothetical protein